jgi:ATP-dependent Clp protease ATP-binding subunit ClpX
MEVNDMFTVPRRPLRCSFCGKQAKEVGKLVAGPKACICDACVAIAVEIMETPRASDPA